MTEVDTTVVDLQIMSLVDSRGIVEHIFQLRKLLNIWYGVDYRFDEVLNSAVERLLREGSIVKTSIGYEPPPAGMAVAMVSVLSDEALRKIGDSAYFALAENNPTELQSLVATYDERFEKWVEWVSGVEFGGEGDREAFRAILKEMVRGIPETARTEEMQRFLEV